MRKPKTLEQLKYVLVLRRDDRVEYQRIRNGVAHFLIIRLDKGMAIKYVDTGDQPWPSYLTVDEMKAVMRIMEGKEKPE